ncbi:MAG: hypothetical protein QXJ72_05615 [Thermoproteota archaeon]
MEQQVIAEIPSLAWLFEESKPIVPVSFETNNPLAFVNLLKAVRTLVDETSIYVDPIKQAIVFRTLDLAEVSLIDAIFIPERYEVQNHDYPFAFNMRIEDFTRLMPKLSKKDYERLTVVIHGDHLEARIKDTTFKVPVYELGLVGYNVKMFPLPQIISHTRVDVVLADLIDAVERLKAITDYVELSYVEDHSVLEKYLKVSGKGEISEFSTRIQIYNYDSYDENDKASYDLRRLLSILKALKRLSNDKTDWVKVEFSTDFPLKITLNPRNSPIQYVTYYVAPRMEKRD